MSYLLLQYKRSVTKIFFEMSDAYYNSEGYSRLVFQEDWSLEIHGLIPLSSFKFC